jgi:hypothetical protein
MCITNRRLATHASSSESVLTSPEESPSPCNNSEDESGAFNLLEEVLYALKTRTDEITEIDASYPNTTTAFDGERINFLWKASNRADNEYKGSFEDEFEKVLKQINLKSETIQSCTEL